MGLFAQNSRSLETFLNPYSKFHQIPTNIVVAANSSKTDRHTGERK